MFSLAYALCDKSVNVFTLNIQTALAAHRASINVPSNVSFSCIM